MKDLPRPARLYVGAIIVLGVCLLVVLIPWTTGFAQYHPEPYRHGFELFFCLLLLSCVCSVFKVKLPLVGGSSTMSVSYAVDFGALVLLGPNLAMVISALSVLSQCTTKRTVRNPFYKIVFSMAALVITVQAAGRAYWDWLPRLLGTDGTAIVARLAGAITIYFLVNTFLVAGAVAFSSSKSLLRVWRQNFLWSAPGSLRAGASR